MKKIIISITIAAILGTPNLAKAWVWGAGAADLSAAVPKLWPPFDGFSWEMNPPKKQAPKPPALAKKSYMPLIDLLKKQLEVKKEHLEQTKQMYGSITGNRKFGASQVDYNSFFLKNPQSIYNEDKKSDISVSVFVSLHDILKKEQISDSISEARKSIEGRSQYAAVVDKAVSLQTFQETDNRFKQISELVEQINTTVDLKSIAELQARIKGMLAMIQNEATKLQMVAHSRNAEQALISQQKQKRNMRILNRENKGMPIIRSIR